MSRTYIGLILLALFSLALGVLAGLRFFHLFEITVPPAVLTDFSKDTARWAFVGYGLGGGAIMFVWSLLVLLLARLFRKPVEPAGKSDKSRVGDVQKG